MAINQALLTELKIEAANTRRVLERVPTEHFDWKPHEKSFSLGHLASHVAQLLTWIGYTINQDGIDFSKHDVRTLVKKSTEDLLSQFDDALVQETAILANASDEVLNEMWTMRNGEQVYFSLPKKVVLRTWYYNHMIHHRGQLTVYLRLLNIPVPGLYGPSADER